MTNGNLAVVGKLITIKAVEALPPGPGVGPDEGVVEVPLQVFISAAAEFFANAA